MQYNGLHKCLNIAAGVELAVPVACLSSHFSPLQSPAHIFLPILPLLTACRYHYNTVVMAASFRNAGEIRELAG
jgi:hypothetical protein